MILNVYIYISHGQIIQHAFQATKTEAIQLIIFKAKNPLAWLPAGLSRVAGSSVSTM